MSSKNDIVRVLQIGKFYPPYLYGGIETVSSSLHIALQNSDEVRVEFLGFLPKGYKKDIQKDGIYLCKTNIDRFSTQFSWSFLKKWISIKDDFDVIFINLPHPVANIAVSLFPPKKAKVILYWHSDIIKQKKLLYFYKPLLKRLIKKSALVAAPTSIHLTESDFSEYFKGKEKVLPFVLNYKTEKADYKLTVEGKKIIFSCGRLIYYKGFDVLIEAAKFLDPSTVVYISGSGPLKNDLTRLIKENDLEDKVKLLGKLSYEELCQMYKDCYLYCFPSNERGEMMGLVQYEALSVGKPIVSTNIPRSGAPTLNIEGRTGFRVPINEPRLMAESINKLVTDEVLYKQFCSNAIKQSLIYNSEKVVDEYIKTFRSICEE